MAQLRRRHAFALGLATSSGLFAAILVRDFTQSQVDQARRRYQPVAPKVVTTPVVVASDELRFGTLLKQEHLKEVQWPNDSIPDGTYSSVTDMFKEQGNRVVLDGMRKGEPILTNKITGPGQKPGLASMLQDGMKAISLRVNEVIGVSGFLAPGDYVDVLLTFTPPQTSGSPDKTDASKANPILDSYTERLLENVRVLGVDQTLDPASSDEKRVARTVTVEATLSDSQKITLASTVGSLSLVLRKGVGTAASEPHQRVTFADLSEDSGDKNRAAELQTTNVVAPNPPPVTTPNVETHRDDQAKVTIVRSLEKSEYSVKRATTGDK